MDHDLSDISVHEYRVALSVAAELAATVVQPAALREPVRLWLLAKAEEAQRQQWRSLLGRRAVAAWSAARAIIDHQEQP